MNMVVGTVPVQVPLDMSQSPLLQNMGPGVIYFDTESDVSAATGLELAVGEAYEFPDDLRNVGTIYVVATVADTDLRYMAVR